MRKRALLLVLIAFISTPGWAQIKSFPKLTDTLGHPAAIVPGKAGTAIIFLSPECPLCKNYGPALQEIRAKFPGIKYYGVVPGKAYTTQQISNYARQYVTGYTILTDKKMQLVKQLKATTTPEVVLLDKHGNIYYRGLIDNWVSALGKKRARATELYFSDALSGLVAGSPIKPTFTAPIGCLINEY